MLVSVLIVCLFFRLYKFPDFFDYNHDQDLNGWVIKDIAADHHLRLIGYETRVPGIFIGPLYFYFLSPFYLITNFNPLAVVFQTLVISLLTALSIYYTFSKSFSKDVALVGAFIYSSSYPLAVFDRWTVPTQLVLVWSIWFLYCLSSVIKGDKNVYYFAGFLLAMIWNIHITLFPLALLLFIAFLFSPRKNNGQNILKLALSFFVFSSPFWLFEIRHHFEQTISLFKYFSQNETAVYISSTQKGIMAIDGVKIALARPFQFLQSIPGTIVFLFAAMLLTYLKIKKVLQNSTVILLISWLAIVMISQTISHSAISDYYFNSILALSIMLSSLLIATLVKKQSAYIPLLLIILIYNIFTFMQEKPLTYGFIQKQDIVNYIRGDAMDRNYPCIGVTYIAPPGQGVGFRFMLWRSGLKIVNPNNEVPVYNITIPTLRKVNEIKFDDIGLIVPPKEQKNISEDVCRKSENQPLPPLGFN